MTRRLPAEGGDHTISDQIEQPNGKRSTITAVLACRLSVIAAALGDGDGWARQIVGRAACRLSACAVGERRRDGTRCGAAYCPRCARQRAAAYRRRLDSRLYERARRGAPYGFGLLTLTIAGNSPGTGRTALGRAFARFLRRPGVRELMAGGEAHVQIEPARGSDGDRWNVHLHAVVELRRPLDWRSPKTLRRSGPRFAQHSTCAGRRTCGSGRTWNPTLSPLPAAAPSIQPLHTSHDETSPIGSLTMTRYLRAGSCSWRTLPVWSLLGGRGGRLDDSPPFGGLTRGRRIPRQSGEAPTR